MMPIIVEGRVKTFLENFVVSLSQAGPTDQLARWKDEVCPVVTGIDPAEAAFMQDRIVQLAQTVGLRRGRSDCVTTLMVVVTPDASSWSRNLVREYPITLRRDGGFGRLRQFTETTAAVRWISVINECGEACALPGSRLRKATKPTFDDMIIVVDADQIGGLTIGELSDYVAVVALSNPPMVGSKPSASILSMFGTTRDPSSPFALTNYDRSFLKGLYGSTLDQSAKVQRQTIVSHMKKDLAPPGRP
jgi:hypothetical protein